MEKKIITISREFGSGGRTVGKRVAELLGVIPHVGANFETDEVRGLVTQMERRRVTKVRIWRKETQQDTEKKDN